MTVFQILEVITPLCGGASSSRHGCSDFLAVVSVLIMLPFDNSPLNVEHHSQYSRDACLVHRMAPLLTGDFYLLKPPELTAAYLANMPLLVYVEIADSTSKGFA